MQTAMNLCTHLHGTAGVPFIPLLLLDILFSCIFKYGECFVLLVIESVALLIKAYLF